MRSTHAGTVRHGRHGRHAHPERRASHRDHGFTLVELVAVLVIIASLAVIALQAFRELRYGARVAALEGIRATIVANATLVRTAWSTQGGGPTVPMQGLAIPVATSGQTDTLGAPTGAGMDMLLGCGNPAYTSMSPQMPCASLPGYTTVHARSYFYIWPTATGSFSDTRCYVAYVPFYGYRSGIPLGPAYEGDPYTILYQSSEVGYYPSMEVAGGC
jgi:prepilin-type N-terminal cleavage/methylation domain-containing protein